MAKFRGEVKVCSECGTAFRVPPSRAHTAKYCSPGCADKHRHDTRPVGHEEVICRHCGKAFKAYTSQAKHRVYCSHECERMDKGHKLLKSKASSGSKNGMWKGGRQKHSDGYVYVCVSEHPFEHNGRVLEHRMVMENWLRENDPSSPFLVKLGDKLYLKRSCVVHHKDGNRVNNDINNLAAMSSADHKKLHDSLKASKGGT